MFSGPVKEVWLRQKRTEICVDGAPVVGAQFCRHWYLVGARYVVRHKALVGIGDGDAWTCPGS
jgi:hypothetical protein